MCLLGQQFGDFCNHMNDNNRKPTLNYRPDLNSIFKKIVTTNHFCPETRLTNKKNLNSFKTVEEFIHLHLQMMSDFPILN